MHAPRRHTEHLPSVHRNIAKFLFFMEPSPIVFDASLWLSAAFTPALPPNHKSESYSKTWAESFLNPTTRADRLQPLPFTKWRPGGAELGSTSLFIVP